MSLDATQWAWSQRGLPANQKLILLSLADRAGEDFTCWPSMARLVLDTGLNIKTVRSCLKQLVEAGILSRERNPGRESFRYTLIGVVGREHKQADLQPNTTEIGSTESGSTKVGTTEIGGTESGSRQVPISVADRYQNREVTGTEIGTRISKESKREPGREPKAVCAIPSGYRAAGGTLVCHKSLARERQNRGDPPPADWLSPFYLPVKSPGLCDVAYIKAENWATWVETFGEEMCLACLRSAYRWAQDNPENAKTPGGIHKFLGGWIDNEQNVPAGKQRFRGGGAPAPVKSFQQQARDSAWEEFDAITSGKSRSGGESVPAGAT